MRYLALLMLVGSVVNSGVGVRAEPEKDQKAIKKLYDAVGGPWRPEDENSSLTFFWLSRREKEPVPPGESSESPADSTWRLRLDFINKSPEGYDGAPEKVEVEGDGLTVTLVPPGKDEKRGTRTVRIRKDGDKLEVRVTGGKFEGTYKLKRVPSKQ